MRLLRCALFLVVASASSGQEPLRGTLCVGESSKELEDCRPTTGTQFAVDPSDRERLFLWSSADSKLVNGGILPKDAVGIDLDRGFREVKLSIHGDQTRGWPADLRLSVAGDKRQWKWTTPAKSVHRLTSIRLPAANYSLILSADRHQTLRRRGVNVSRLASVDLGRLDLAGLPVVRGMVIDEEDKPIRDADVVAEGRAKIPDKICATTDERGLFQCELEEPPAEAISIEYPGLGRRVLVLPREVTAHDFGRIVLAKGSELILQFQRPPDLLDRELEVRLLYDIRGKHERTERAKAKLTAAAEQLVFADLSKGDYLAIVSGSGPLERLTVPVKVEESAVEQRIEIRPYTLRGEIRIEENRVAAKGSIGGPGNTWRVDLTAPDGLFGGVMWQHGRVHAIVQTEGSDSSELVGSPELGDDPSLWPIILKDRYISGRVFDARTKEPLANAKISLQAVFAGDGRFYTSVPVKPDGTYRLHANRAGEYRFAVKAGEEYSPREVEILVSETDVSKQVDLPLERGSIVVLEIVSASGNPLPNATVVEGFGDYGINPSGFHTADASGRLRLTVPKGETRTLYVVPGEGSFAIVRLRGGDEERPEKVVVPAPVATLRLRPVDREGKAARCWPLLRFNGEWVPSSISTRISPSWFSSSKQGEIVLSGLPAGVYEVWGFARPEEQSAFIARGGGNALVRMGLSGGEETVQLVVQERE